MSEDELKDMLDRLPSYHEQALAQIDQIFYGEFKAGKLKSAEHADDRAVEIAGEVAIANQIEIDGDDFNEMLQRAFRLGRTVRPLLTP